jgi:hypothetical protein
LEEAMKEPQESAKQSNILFYFEKTKQFFYTASQIIQLVYSLFGSMGVL